MTTLIFLLGLYLGGAIHVLLSIMLGHKFARTQEDRVTQDDLGNIACAVVAWPALCFQLWIMKDDES